MVRLRPAEKPLEVIRTYHDMDKVIAANLPRIRQIPFDVIVHMPRSGTAPAAMMATYLNKPLASCDEICAHMAWTRNAVGYDARMKRLLLVDDHVNRGVQMRPILERIKRERPDCTVTTLAVYSSGREKVYTPDVVLDNSGLQYLYPWFMWKSTFALNPCALDMDGVLCRDCLPEEDDEGERYAAFLAHAEPKLIPHARAQVTIVTSRLARYRPQTLLWLKTHGVNVVRLVMGPWRDNAERRGQVARWKAAQYAALDSRLYVESDDRQAPEIARLSRKPVYCIDSCKSYGELR